MRNNLHSFTLKYEASKIVRREPRGRKSRFVSDAIFWYDRIGIRTKDNQELKIRELVETNQRMVKNHARVCKENFKLREELEKNESFISKMLKLFRK